MSSEVIPARIAMRIMADTLIKNHGLSIALDKIRLYIEDIKKDKVTETDSIRINELEKIIYDKKGGSYGLYTCKKNKRKS